MDKVVAVMDRPNDCGSCVFCRCAFSHPFWSKDDPNTVGYYCQLRKRGDRKVEKFDMDAEVHLSDCPLRPLPKKQPLTFTDMTVLGWNACIEEICGE